MVSATVILLDPLVAVCVIEDVAVASSRRVTATAPERAARLLGSYTTRWDAKSYSNFRIFGVFREAAPQQVGLHEGPLWLAGDPLQLISPALPRFRGVPVSQGPIVQVIVRVPIRCCWG